MQSNRWTMGGRIRLNVNIDHIATIRQARRTFEPSVVTAAALADLAGASGITIHLRGDRRHIQDEDVRTLRAVVKTHLNLEMAATDEMVKIARDVRPDTVTLVPERPDEITTEGGLDSVSHEEEIRRASAELREAGVLVSIFLDPDMAQVEAAHRAGARQVEICTAKYAELTDPTTHAKAAEVDAELARVAECASGAGELGIQVAAGHGLTYRNVAAIAEIYPIEELNIGHNIVARAALVGMERAVREMIAAINGRVL
ncbi:MAG TPA: pyridoxine 5'-phosphate synthase [Blastocatellia bacterium]|jgi:pyridoxine 5-phosphate synthase|nr:pyridoxine 5'-phosphate synthase [Blastocatellia bacterium]